MSKNMDIPENITLSNRQQPSSVAVLTCPICQEKRYVSQEFTDLITFLRSTESEIDIEAVLPRHKTCNAIMEMRLLTEKERDMVTVDDLERVFFRAQADDSARWVNVSAKEASNRQFDAWAKSRIEIQGDDAPWELSERADFCNMLWQSDALVMLKKDVNFEDE